MISEPTLEHGGGVLRPERDRGVLLALGGRSRPTVRDQSETQRGSAIIATLQRCFLVTMVAYNGDELPQLHVEDEGDETYGRIVAEPLRAGFGMTIGNALRRTLLSALPGAAITAVRIEGVEHEFSTIPHMKEDMIEFLLNMKDIRIRALSDRPGKMYLEATGPGEVTAGNIQQTADYEVVNPDLHLATLDSARSPPVRRDHRRAGRRLPAGRLGRWPADRRHPRRRHLLAGAPRQLQRRAHARRPGDELRPPRPRNLDGRHDQPGGRREQRRRDPARTSSRCSHGSGARSRRWSGAAWAPAPRWPPDRYNTPIEDLNLSVRAYNCLKRAV